MNLLNRRTLIKTAVAGATVLAISPVGKLMAQVRRDDRSYESRFTGSVVELLDSDWIFSSEFTRIEDTHEYVREAVVARSESTRTTIEIEFLRPSVNPERYIDIVLERHAENWDIVELADSGSGPDGPWFAASLLWIPKDGTISEMPALTYCEYQAGAFEGEDLVIMVNCRPESFDEGINLVQSQVLIGDLPPLTMLESSQVMSLAFPVLSSSTATETSTGRNSRSTRGSSGDEETSETNSRDNQRGQSQTGSSTTSDYPADIRAHRTLFIASFNEFAEALSQFVDESSTDASMQQAYATLDRVAGDWTSYPVTVQQLTAPQSYLVLEGLYLTWADEIGALGQAWIDAVNGAASGDDVFNQIDVVDRADKALVAELDSL